MTPAATWVLTGGWQPEGHHFWADVTNRFLHAEGIIDYVSAQPIPDLIRTALRKECEPDKDHPDVKAAMVKVQGYLDRKAKPAA
jgi:hypothetical protein